MCRPNSSATAAAPWRCEAEIPTAMRAALVLFTVAAAIALGGNARAADSTSGPLMDAVAQRDASAVRRLVKAGANVNAPQPDGSTPLMWAAHWNDVSSAALL